MKNVLNLLQENPKALYVHCHAHALNLAVQDTVKKNTLLKDTMAIVAEISSIIRTSPKRNALLERLKEVHADDEKAGRITTFCPTRLALGLTITFKHPHSFFIFLWA